MFRYETARADGSWWGRLLENEIGARLKDHLQSAPLGVNCERDETAEVDFLVSLGTKTWAIEVKSGRGAPTSGLSAFQRRSPQAAT